MSLLGLFTKLDLEVIELTVDFLTCLGRNRAEMDGKQRKQ